MNRKLWWLMAAMILAGGLAHADKLWLDDLNKGIEKAKAEDKFLLLNFSGSDWCGWCIKLEDEVFGKKEFKTYAQANLICVVLDFPRSKSQSKKVQERNNALRNKYGIRGFPSILILSPQGDVIGRTGYRPGGPAQYIKELQHIIDLHKSQNKK